jgi:hypothetical protein
MEQCRSAYRVLDSERPGGRSARSGGARGIGSEAALRAAGRVAALEGEGGRCYRSRWGDRW